MEVTACRWRQFRALRAATCERGQHVLLLICVHPASRVGQVSAQGHSQHFVESDEALMGVTLDLRRDFSWTIHDQANEMPEVQPHHGDGQLQLKTTG